MSPLSPSVPLDAVATLQEEIVSCTQCPRLVDWREQVAREKVKRFAHETYWGRPVPSFGDPHARLLIVGLAPAAHGANRTGRMFTGDKSGDWLYRALYRAGFANQETSTFKADGLTLHDCYITAMNHCAPPANKPLPTEKQNCRPFLIRELQLLTQVKVLMPLGKEAFDTLLQVYAERGVKPAEKRPAFGHGVEVTLTDRITLLASYHPSQQNTFTGKLTEPMFDAVFNRAKALLSH